MINFGMNSTTGTVGEDWGYSTVSGGRYHTSSNVYTTVGGGYNNQATSGYATVSGGAENHADGLYSFVGGGWSNEATDAMATIPGGSDNEASGHISFAAGEKAKARHDGAFVWADNSNTDFASTDDNQFLIRAEGGVGIGLNDPTTALEVDGTIKSRSGGFEFPNGTIQTTATESVMPAPIGSIIAWLKSYPNTPLLSSDYVECNGQVLYNTASLYHGQTIPDLNGGGRFLRGGSSSGVVGGTTSHNHTVDVDDSVVVPAGLWTHSAAEQGVYTTSSKSHLPSYYRVVWIMKIK